MTAPMQVARLFWKLGYWVIGPGDVTVTYTQKIPPLKSGLAAVVRRVPLLIEIAQWFYRLRLAHPTVGVVGVITDDEGRILLVEHIFHPKHPWGLPGGWMERGEGPEETLKRELVEEIGLQVTIRRPLLVRRKNGYEHLDMAFLCEPQGEVHEVSAELLRFQWFRPDELPPLSDFHTQAVEEALRVFEVVR